MIIISGPSTIGKNPFIYKACELYDLKFVIPCTTRMIRSEEKDGRDYFFFPKTEFQSKIKNGEIKEWDYCLDNYYGYMFEFPGDNNQITHGLSRMALRIKDKYPNEITTIFLMPSNKDSIFSNLKQIYSGETLALRTALVEEEINHSVLFDKVYSVSNTVLDLLYEKEIMKLLLGKS